MEINLYNKEIKNFIKGHLDDDPFSLSLHADKKQNIPVEWAIQQIHARQKAKNKLPDWYCNLDLIFPPPVSVEQASSEKTAAYKATLYAGRNVADLTGGMGVDSVFLAKRFNNVYYVEHNPELVELAKYNFECLGLGNIVSVNETAQSFLNKTNEHFDLIYLDPGRRKDAGRKTFLLQHSEPNVLTMLESLFIRTDKVLLKLSPLLDIKHAIDALKHVVKVWVVAVNNECKELLFLLSKNTSRLGVEAIDLVKDQNGFIFNYEDEATTVAAMSDPLTYLYEPHVAILKAGAFKTICRRYGVYKLHPHTHLYTSDEYLVDFPGRVFTINNVLPAVKKQVLEHLPSKKANISVRNYPIKPEEIKKKWKIYDGGGVYLFLTTLHDDQRAAIICGKSGDAFN